MRRLATFPDAKPPQTLPGARALALLDAARDDIKSGPGEKARRAAMLVAIESARTAAGAETLDSSAIAQVSTALGEINSEGATESPLTTRWIALLAQIGELETSLRAAHPDDVVDAVDAVTKRLPAFVYYSNYGNLDSEIYLPHVIANMKRKGLDGRTDQRIRHAAMTMLVAHAVVDIDLCALPRGDLITMRRKCAHRGPIDRFEGRAPATIELLEWARVELGDELADCRGSRRSRAPFRAHSGRAPDAHEGSLLSCS